MKGRYVMVITENLKRRFVKDTGLPIKIFDDSVFFDRLRLFEPLYQSMTKWKKFEAYLKKFHDEREFFEEHDRVKQAAIDFITSQPAMWKFGHDEDMNQYRCKNTDYPGNGVFKDCHVGKYLLSIDMVKANFTALRHYSASIFGDAETYDEFISQFSDSEYVQSSKYIRQVIFGNINPKRQQTYERYLMDQVLTNLFSRLKIERKKVLYFGTDEIVVDISEFVDEDECVNENTLEMIQRVVDISRENGINVRAELYQLMKVVGTDGYLKNFFTEFTRDSEFKCLDPMEYPFVIRHYFSEKPRPCDFVFQYEGRKAQLLDPIKVKFTCHLNESEAEDES